jgi:hypothetical protein
MNLLKTAPKDYPKNEHGLSLVRPSNGTGVASPENNPPSSASLLIALNLWIEMESSLSSPHRKSNLCQKAFHNFPCAMT